MMDIPLVSCLMTTRNRPDFVRQAIRSFVSQSYPRAELVLADGGEQTVEDLCAGVKGVRYVRAAGTTCGEGLNMAAEHAQGEILQVFDDDDYYAPSFVERAVTALLQSPYEDTIVAWDCFLVLLRGEKALRFSGHGWAAGATLCFRRRRWEQTPFRPWPGVDYHFLNESAVPVEHVCAPELYILVRHGRNHWKDLKGGDVDAYFRSLPPSGQTIADVASSRAEFYETL